MLVKGTRGIKRVAYFNCPSCYKLLPITMHKLEARTDRHCIHCGFDIQADREAKQKAKEEAIKNRKN